MTKYSLKRRAMAVVMGVLFLFLQFLEPVYSQTSLNGCFTSATNAQQCARDGLISPTSASNYVRNAVGSGTAPPFTGVSPAAIPFLGAAGALGYLTAQNMQNLQNQAMSQASADYSSCTAWYPVIDSIGATFTGAGTFPTAAQAIAYLSQNPAYGSISATPAPSCVASPATPQSAAQGLTDPQIYAEAAAAAAAAARDFANKKDVAGAQTAAAAAAAAAGVVAASPSATQADKDKANGAAAAAAAAAADAADPTKAPSTPQNPGFAFTRVNFLAYAVSAQGFGNKFPFGMFAPLPASNTQMSCPVVSSWGTSVELCFIRDIIRVIKWIVWSNFAIYCFVNL